MPKVVEELPLRVVCPKRGCTAAWYSETDREDVIDALSTHYHDEHPENYGPPVLASLDNGHHWRRFEKA